MKKIFSYSSLLLFVSSLAHATVTQVQVVSNGACGTSTTCTISNVTTTAGNLLIFTAVWYPVSGAIAISSTTGETSTSAGKGCTFSAGGTSSGDIAYNLSAAGGTHSIVFHGNGTNYFYSVALVEYHNSNGKWRYIGGNKLNNATGTAGSIISTPAYTASTPSALVFAQVIPDDSVNSGTAVSGGGAGSWTTPLPAAMDISSAIPLGQAIGVAIGFNTVAGFTDNTASDPYCSEVLEFAPTHQAGYILLQ